MDAESLLPALQLGDAVLIWNMGAQAYDTYTFFSAGQWVYPDNVTVGPAPVIPSGTGFFYANGQGDAEVNTVAGTVILNNTNAPVSLQPSVYTLIGSFPPIDVSLDSANINLPLQLGDAVLIWNQGAQAYDTYTFFDYGSWVYPDNVTVGPGPTVNLGTGFFYANGQGAAEIWSQNLIVP